MTGKQLKNSILQWAIQGKLVPQDPNDEPASVLLEKIRAEKERLIKEGKIKKDKKESIIFRGEDNSYYEKFTDGKVVCIDDEIPFEIPDNWCFTRLGCVCDYLHRGKSPKYGMEHVLPIIAQKCNQWDKIYTDRCLFSDLSNISKYTEEQYLQKGDIIINSTGGGTVGRTGIVEDYIFEKYSKFVADSHVTVVRGNNLLNPRYIYYYLISPNIQTGIEERCSGSTNQIELGTSTIYNYLIPVPPYKEQLRIIELMRVLLQKVEKYGREQEKLENLRKLLPMHLKKSILQEAIQGRLVVQKSDDEPASLLLQRIKEEKLLLVKEGKLKKKDVVDSVIYKGDDNKYYEQIDNNRIDITDDIPFDIPNNWIWTRIGYIFAHNNGKQLNKGNSTGTLMEYITTSNLYWDGFRLENLKKMTYEEKEIERCQAIKGDLLVCEGGDVGRSCIWTYDTPIMLQNHIHKLRAYTPLCTKYFYYIFLFYNSTGLIGGKGIGIQGFSAKALHNTIIPLPPLIEQERIVKKIEILFDRIMN